jgi:RNA polymerase sigma factor (sigma-70 family)
LAERPQPERGEHALASVFRREAGQIVGGLTRATGNFELAEESVQDAVVAALERWPRDGVPDRPGAWLTTVARNRAIDLLRRDRRQRDKLSELELQPPAEDDRLRLMFLCCHPALGRETQLALTLRAGCGFTTAEIAHALLTSEAAIDQRISRGRRKVVRAGIAYRIPDESELDLRLEEVRTVLYLMFNEGYLPSHGTASRRDFAQDALWLTEQLAALYPREPEVLGLLALIRLHLARWNARFGPDEELVLLSDQDRSLWDRKAIAEGISLIERAAALARPGAFQLQAAILACHAEAAHYRETDWAQILVLYDVLLALSPTPVVRLNRAVALREVAGAATALAEVDTLSGQLAGYHLFHAVRGRLLVDLGRREQARAAELKALSLTRNPAERALLEERRAAR